LGKRPEIDVEADLCPHVEASGDSVTSHFDPPSAPGGRSRRFAISTAYTASSQFAKVVIQFLSVVVMARVLAPSDFGLVAMAAPVLTFATMFVDLGLAQATVQKEKLTQVQSSSMFWVNVAVGAGICVLLAVTAPLVGRFYSDHRVGAISATLGVALLIGSAGAQHIALLTRSMRFGVLAWLDTGRAVTILAASVTAALLGAGYWSLVIGPLAGSICSTTAAWIATGWRPSRPSRDEAFRDMLGFGAGVTGFNLSNFFSRNLDNILIGWRWGPVQIGLYDRAYKLLLFPMQQVTTPLSRIMVPLLSRLREDPVAYRRAYLDVCHVVLLAATPGVIVLIATADIVVPMLMGARWSGVVPIFLALGFTAIVQFSNNPSGWLFISQARTKEFAFWGLLSGSTCAVAFWLGLSRGAIGVAIAYSVVEFFKAPILQWVATRKGPVTFSNAATILVPHIVWTVLSLAALFGLRSAYAFGPITTLAGAILISYGIAVATSLAFARTRESTLRSIRLVRNLALSGGAVQQSS
jgi:PST family polysaccharide transporter